jgi:hypothetical protein
MHVCMFSRRRKLACPPPPLHPEIGQANIDAVFTSQNSTVLGRGNIDASGPIAFRMPDLTFRFNPNLAECASGQCVHLVTASSCNGES